MARFIIVRYKRGAVGIQKCEINGCCLPSFVEVQYDSLCVVSLCCNHVHHGKTIKHVDEETQEYLLQIAIERQKLKSSKEDKKIRK